MTPGTVLTLPAPPVTRGTLALFAGASGDHNLVHIDADEARAAGLPDVFAQGMLSMAYLGSVLTASFPVEAVRSFAVRFTAITPVHAQPTCTATVTAVENGLASLDLNVTLADGTVTLTGSAVVALEEHA